MYKNKAAPIYHYSIFSFHPSIRSSIHRSQLSNDNNHPPPARFSDLLLYPTSLPSFSPNQPAKAPLPSLFKSSNILLNAFIGTGFVRNRSTPLLNASCLVLGFAAPVSAIRATGGRLCSFSYRRMCCVDSMPDMIGIEISVSISLVSFFFFGFEQIGWRLEGMGGRGQIYWRRAEEVVTYP